ncbi:MAG: bifunctional diaminohydroxyphosphoribosylaminopyrimidine deaminase/5-amino-6-(5-phosphoribosylamino)uracil reductase RibD [Candidatus Acetothermia bacterium]|jgi:diaminohydroxyphosphoribosylaminopyrimidine deaminase/5-amino-6-(5-phosphoribosylamino)uracil reductase|nr:bifunctional diaminohydroxyphosphoribosylaminopyrimidine deaminase/5-amino-6-(5-phosphoribosylamino)uracil reductase RibD [Candidatus Acetothermia bacterium]MDH7505520.1 bifunctional diaminohydroxyphosphoribosylaminopyrimidine deaminase/5-amino-6-(5-phosphoribosylamino)uracil reductase RibD [Candidatus Acetothermia bacterium]
MRRALELAERGAGWTSPNPLVGAVIVRGGRIVGEGYHQRFGGPHAEVLALEAAGEEASGADLYVTLEPCVHWGKTPPCVEWIIGAGIKRVIVAVRDPNPLVDGRGLARLRQAGIEVVEGVLAEEARKLNEPFFKFITTGRPFVILKLAMSLDGRSATRTGESRWISNERSRELVHWMRSRYAAVLVGINTVLKDDPQLTARLEGARDPWRIILDSEGRLPLDAQVLRLESAAPTVVATTQGMPPAKEEELLRRGARVWRLKSRAGRVDLADLLARMGAEGLDSLLVEGGPTVAASFLEAGLVDKIVFFIAPKIVGGPVSAIAGSGVERLTEAWQLRDISVRMLDGDLVYESYLG